MIVGLISTTSSFLRLLELVLPNSVCVTRLLELPGRPELWPTASTCISPPIATILPSVTRTTVSVSLTLLEASGSL